MIYIMLIIGIVILGFGVILQKREYADNISDNYNDIFADEKEVKEESVDFKELVEKKISEKEISNDLENRYHGEEIIHAKLDKIEEMLVSISDITDKEKKLLSIEKELLKRERAIKRNENRIDKLVEAKVKNLSKGKSATKTNSTGDKNKTKSVTNTRNTTKEIEKNTSNKSKEIDKIRNLEEEGKSLEEIASELSMGKGEVLLLRNLQKQLKK
ncbi:hypothetical protein SH2C18_11780 [Clostridium sediminicola]|uniref:DUF6115 domain-containing protein n=1 Tax=Clostridium sediminicola TaxID=3114879 RepID=UPI0031F25135